MCAIKLLEISAHSNLEKLYLTVSLPVLDKTIFKILENCPNLRQIILGKQIFHTLFYYKNIQHILKIFTF